LGCEVPPDGRVQRVVTPPAGLEASVELLRMADGGKADHGPALEQLLPPAGQGQIVGNLESRLSLRQAQRQAGDEVLGLEPLTYKLCVLGQPEIVVGEVEDRVAARLLDRFVAVPEAVLSPLRPVEKTHARIRRHYVLERGACSRGNAVADDEHLEVLLGL